MKRDAEFFLGRTIQNGTIHLAETLGAGGFGIAFKAYEQNKNPPAEPVVVKFFNSDADSVATATFLREAFHLTRLKHPNIVPVYDIGVEPVKVSYGQGREVTENYPFFVMQYADRGDVRRLKPRVSVEPAAIQTVLPITSSIAEALQYAHDDPHKPLIHRDVKPENMLRRFNPTTNQIDVLLTDFGVAAIAHTANSLMGQDSVGTPPYMAPEQFLGKAVRQTDQYALAIFVYEFLTGRLPFQGEGIQRNDPVLIQLNAWHNIHQNELPPTFEEALKSTGKGGLLADRVHAPIFRALQDVVFKALAKNPDERFDRILTFAQTLEKIAKDARAEKLAQKPFQGADIPVKPAQIEPTMPSSQDIMRKAKSLVGQQSYKDAIPLLERIIQLEPTNSQAYVNIALVFIALGKSQEANDYLNQALKLNPSEKMKERILQLKGKDTRRLRAGTLPLQSQPPILPGNRNSLAAAQAIPVSQHQPTSSQSLYNPSGKDASSSPQYSHRLPVVSRRALLISLGIGIAAAGLGFGGYEFFKSFGPSDNKKTLYTENGADKWQGWSLSGDWDVSKGVLFNTGAFTDAIPGASRCLPPIVVPSTGAFAVEVTAGITEAYDASSAFGLSLDGSDPIRNTSGASFSIDPQAGLIDLWVAQASQVYQESSFSPGQNWHTYRMEVHDTLGVDKVGNIKLFIDEQKYFDITAENFFPTSNFNLFSYGTPLAVNNFSVFAI